MKLLSLTTLGAVSLLACLFWPVRGFGSAETDLRHAEAISLALTGLPLTSKDRAEISCGKWSPADFAEARRRHPRMQERLAGFWSRKLRINKNIGIRDIADAAGTTVQQDLVAGPKSRPGTTRSMLLVYHPAVTGAPGCENGFLGLTALAPAGPGTPEAELKSRDEFTRAAVECGCAGTVPVAPYWNTSRPVQVCAAAVPRCGNDLSECYVADDRNGLSSARFKDFDYIERVESDFTQEPGLLAARIILDDRSWDDMVRGTESLHSGPTLHFLKHFGSQFLHSTPPGSYSSPTKPTELSFDEASAGDPTVRWVHKGGVNAGVLTTVGFQKSHRSWRDKAAVTLDALLCRTFPPLAAAHYQGSSAYVIDRTPACTSCHQKIDPLAQFFGRWTNDASPGFLYQVSAARSAVGAWEGSIDADTSGLGRVLSNTADFNRCGVARAFEFLAGRPLTPLEATTYMAHWMETFASGEKRLWPVMKEMLTAAPFREGAP